MFRTQKTFYFFTNYHLVFFRSTWLVAHGRRNAYQQKFWRSFNCFLNVTMVTFHIWFISMKVEQEKKYLVHLSLLRELMTSCVCVCVCVCVFTSIHLEGFICLGLEVQGTDQRCCVEDIFLCQFPSSILQYESQSLSN